jgi:hypothetical protein
MVIAAAGAAYLAGVFIVRTVLESAVGSADGLESALGASTFESFSSGVAWQFLIGTFFMVLGTVGTIMIGRFLLHMIDVRNPMFTLRVPIAVAVVGVVVTLMWSAAFPLVLIGLVMIAAKVFAEFGPKGETNRLTRSMGSGEMEDWEV